MNPSEEEAEATERRSILRTLRLERVTTGVISASASLIAIAALVTAIYQTKLARDQAHAAVWPYLILGNSGEHGYARIVQNLGLGPAIIRSFEVHVNGHPVRSWKEAADSMHITLTWRDHKQTTFARGLVAPVGAEMDLLSLPDSADVRVWRTALNNNRLETFVCYCSLYGECWNGTNAPSEPRPVKACVENPARAFTE
ncbi:MAG TPA: hypothetical protein VN706_04440 [Gemmatimonadaceae bacterium]|nr:hypothetical protein [Gemmatimonadaceae bacterium]